MVLGIKTFSKTSYELNIQKIKRFTIEINRKYMARRKGTLFQQQMHKIYRRKVKSTFISFC